MSSRERTGAWPARDEFDVLAEAREITFDAAAAALAGFRTGAEVDRLRELFYTLLHGFDAGYESWEAYLQRHSDAARQELGGIAHAR